MLIRYAYKKVNPALVFYGGVILSTVSLSMYKLKLMFEWGGGTIWGDNRAAKELYDVGPIEEKLPLSKSVLEALESLSRVHDGALDWEDPCGSSPWSKLEFERFDKSALRILNTIEGELGGEYEVRYDRVGTPDT